MPAPGTSWSVTLRAADGGVSPRTQGRRGRGEGAIPNGGFRVRRGRSAGALIVHAMMQRSNECGHKRLFSTNKNDGPKAAAVFTQ